MSDDDVYILPEQSQTGLDELYDFDYEPLVFGRPKRMSTRTIEAWTGLGLSEKSSRKVVRWQERLDRQFVCSAVDAADHLSEFKRQHFLWCFGQLSNQDTQSAAAPLVRARWRRRLLDRLAPIAARFGDRPGEPALSAWELKIGRPDWTMYLIDFEKATATIEALLTGKSYVGVWTLNPCDGWPDFEPNLVRQRFLIWSFNAIVWDAVKPVWDREVLGPAQAYLSEAEDRPDFFRGAAALPTLPLTGLKLRNRHWSSVRADKLTDGWRLQSWVELAEIEFSRLVHAGGEGLAVLK